ncbi:MAG: hypothetical protein FWD68_13900 [Alphaproteobacteria bacterium]|nr:hypothetical protein [Alphaproteobacteria bacterium]
MALSKLDRTLMIDQGFRTLRTSIRASTVLFIFYWAFQAVEVLAGQATDVSIALSLALNALVTLKFAVALGVTMAAAGWAVVERYLRLRKVDYLQGRIRELERRTDPDRSTSGLTTSGRTNPKDKLK